MTQPTKQQPPTRAGKMSIFPTLNSTHEVVELIESRLPITDKNELLSLLGIYHNTLLQEFNNGACNG